MTQSGRFAETPAHELVRRTPLSKASQDNAVASASAFAHSLAICHETGKVALKRLEFL